MAPENPLYSRIYTEMASRVRSGEWYEGMRLPSEEKLREEFGTSRGPVRQALAYLRAEGLITGGRGAPPRVRKSIPAQPFDTYVSFTEWAELLGYEPTQTVIEIGRKLADEQIADALDIPKESPVVGVVRARGLGTDPVMIERSTYIFAVGRLLLSADLETSSIYRIFRENGVFPTRSRNVFDAVGADALDARWLGVPEKSPLLRVRRISYDQNGRIIDTTENRYMPERANFVVENTSTYPNALRRQVPDQ